MLIFIIHATLVQEFHRISIISFNCLKSQSLNQNSIVIWNQSVAINYFNFWKGLRPISEWRKNIPRVNQKQHFLVLISFQYSYHLLFYTFDHWFRTFRCIIWRCWHNTIRNCLRSQLANHLPRLQNLRQISSWYFVNIFHSTNLHHHQVLEEPSWNIPELSTWYNIPTKAAHRFNFPIRLP